MSSITLSPKPESGSFADASQTLTSIVLTAGLTETVLPGAFPNGFNVVNLVRTDSPYLCLGFEMQFSRDKALPKNDVHERLGGTFGKLVTTKAVHTQKAGRIILYGTHARGNGNFHYENSDKGLMSAMYAISNITRRVEEATKDRSHDPSDRVTVSLLWPQDFVPAHLAWDVTAQPPIPPMEPVAHAPSGSPGTRGYYPDYFGDGVDLMLYNTMPLVNPELTAKARLHNLSGLMRMYATADGANEHYGVIEYNPCAKKRRYVFKLIDVRDAKRLVSTKRAPHFRPTNTRGHVVWPPSIRLAQTPVNPVIGGNHRDEMKITSVHQPGAVYINPAPVVHELAARDMLPIDLITAGAVGHLGDEHVILPCSGPSK